MKKTLILLCLILSVCFSNTKCKTPVCVYVYKGAMSGEVNIINNTHKTAKVDTLVYLDGISEGFSNLILNPNSETNLIKIRYKDHLSKPRGGAVTLRYSFIEDEKPKEHKREMKSEAERKENIKIKMN